MTRRIRSGTEATPVLRMTAARWFSTVRWLMPRTSAMILFGRPWTTRPMTSRSRGVRLATRSRAVLRQAERFAESWLRSSARDAADKLVGANRFFQKIGGAGLHRADRHGHVPIAGNDDGRQAAIGGVETLQQRDSVHPRHHRVDHQASILIR